MAYRKSCFFFPNGVLHDKSADFPAKNVSCRSISSYVIQARDRSPDHPNAEWMMIEQHWSYPVYYRLAV